MSTNPYAAPATHVADVPEPVREGNFIASAKDNREVQCGHRVKILRPDLQIDNIDATTRWRTFWYLQEDADL